MTTRRPQHVPDAAVRGARNALTLLTLTVALFVGAGLTLPEQPATAATPTAYGITTGIAVGIHGSGAQVIGGRVVRRFPARTFVARPGVPTHVDTWEDGSGVQYLHTNRPPARWQEVRTFPADTFAWDCRVMGNRRCGPAA